MVLDEQVLWRIGRRIVDRRVDLGTQIGLELDEIRTLENTHSEPAQHAFYILKVSKHHDPVDHAFHILKVSKHSDAVDHAFYIILNNSKCSNVLISDVARADGEQITERAG